MKSNISLAALPLDKGGGGRGLEQLDPVGDKLLPVYKRRGSTSTGVLDPQRGAARIRARVAQKERESEREGGREG